MSTNTNEAKIDKEFVEKLSDRRDEPEWVRKRRLNAWRSYEDLPEPHVIQTPGRLWTDLSELDVKARSKATDEQETRTTINADVPDDVVVMDMEDAVREHSEVLKDHFMNKIVRWDENSLIGIHAASWRNGLFVHVPKNTELEEPIETVTELGEEDARFNNIVVIAESNSKVSISETALGGDESYYSNIVEVHAKDGAEVNYGSLQNLSDDSYQFTVKRGVADRNAEVNWIDGCFGTQLTKSVVSSIIDGEGAETNNYGLFYGTGKQHFDLETWTRHNAPNSQCEMFTRGVGDDRSVSAYEGTIEVSKEAHSVDAYQTENVLVVSDDAEADASPRLEIDNHDVKCSHAATVGRIDEEDLFYMKTRGLDEEDARHRIIEGFFEPVFGELPLPELDDDYRELVRQKMD